MIITKSDAEDILNLIAKLDSHVDGDFIPLEYLDLIKKIAREFPELEANCNVYIDAEQEKRKLGSDIIDIL